MAGIYIPNMTVEMAIEKLQDFIYIPVPPHGRCIDADALTVDLMDRGIEGMQTDDWYEIQQAVADAPTIIPAEADEERREYDAQVEAAKYCEMYEPTYDPETGAL